VRTIHEHRISEPRVRVKSDISPVIPAKPEIIAARHFDASLLEPDLSSEIFAASRGGPNNVVAEINKSTVTGVIAFSASLAIAACCPAVLQS
jgi:hypothetical protein